MSRMYIPGLGKEWVAVEGVRPRDIKYAPGHYPESALPGQSATSPSPGTGCPACGVWVVAPGPDKPTATEGTRKLITLTTCNPKWDNYERLIVHGELTREQLRSTGRPAELGRMTS